MAENIPIQTRGKTISTFAKILWTLLIIIYMVAVHFTELNMDGVPGYVFLGLCVFVLFRDQGCLS